MAEYIEREAAVDALNKALFAYEDETEERFKNDPELDIAEWFFHRIFVQHMNGIDRQTILDIPAADVRPVVRGKWRFEIGDGKTCVDGWVCSACNCGFHTNVPYFEGFNFCPNCGADMREES